MSEPCYAHRERDRRQTVRSHLEAAAALASGFAAPFHGEDQAYLAGLLHDLGKYSEAFQRRLSGSFIHVDHSTAGAQEAFRLRQPEVAFAVAGHHGGLPNMGGRMDAGGTLYARIRRKVEPYGRWKEEIQLPDKISRPSGIPNEGVSMAFYIRMLYSCLVDADYLDTEAFMNGEARENVYDSMPELFKKLKKYIAPWQNPELDPEKKELNQRQKELNRRRNDILGTCLSEGRKAEKGLYTLTVPTGGGKTVASLAFALSMACEKKMPRIIYVMPYTSIIDQNADVFARILGKKNVLEHHSGVDYSLGEDATPEERRKALAVENWDAPVIVTTAVQFFESLYANRSSRCRKLHNIGDSIIIFDEAQSLPVPALMPCVSAIAELVRHCGATAVLCTATEPALAPLFAKFALQPTEICPAVPVECFQRTTLYFLDGLTEASLAERLCGGEQVLCVVNRRKTAQELYNSLPEEGSYCLTTLSYPADRKSQLKEIRKRLEDGLPCRVVSTSLIEAGVDVDFPVVYRELTGLDSILQAAGRCNREGKRTAGESPVYIFHLAGQKEPQMLKMNIDATQRVRREFDDPTVFEAVERYFTFYRQLLGEEQLDQYRVLKRFASNEFPFADVAAEFHLIGQECRTVYIPRGEGAQLVERLRAGERSRDLFRQLGQYGVSVYPGHLRELQSAGLVEQLDESAAVLTDPNAYNPHTGLIQKVEWGEVFFS